jgi:Mannosylglycerate hydrolase MGH1-like glycoside hydrolase domain
MSRTTLRILLLGLLVARVALPLSGASKPPSAEYAAVQRRLARGWNTWNNHSMLSQVLLPEGLAIHIGIDRGRLFDNSYLNRALVGQNEVKVMPGPHLCDGSYTDLTIDYRGLKLRVQSASERDDLVLLVTPLGDSDNRSAAASVIFQAGMLWNRPGQVSRVGNTMRAVLPEHRVIPIFTTGKAETDTEVISPGPYLAVSLADPVGLSTGRARALSEIKTIIDRGQARYAKKIAAFGDVAEAADAIETVLGWDTIYEPERGRVLSPVSRSWSEHFGGYVLFDWDNFFAAYMAGLANRDLAYANAIEMVNSLTPGGFVPNFARAKGWDSYDRSEPPVGSIVLLALYQKYGDKWLLRDTFDSMLRWNRWWAEKRDIQGYLAWGSTPNDAPWERDDTSVNTAQGARYESGLDNSPMYDDVPYDSNRHVMELADVGLMSLYIADCHALAKIADTLGRGQEAEEIRGRAQKYAKSLQTLWDDSTGIFRNKNLRTGKLDEHLSPTNFYPLLAKVATPGQAARMVSEHLMNPREFWAEWVIPATPRNEAAFQDQNYWRGRIWGPMNFLVYLGLRNYNLPAARAQLVQKSRTLFLKEWQTNRHVHENYNAILGVGDDVSSSDRFYHWGALLVFMNVLEQGKYDAQAARHISQETKSSQ